MLWFEHSLTTTAWNVHHHRPGGIFLLAAAVAFVKLVHGRRLIGSQQIRYLSVTIWLATDVSGIPDVLAIRRDMPALWQLAYVCCHYDNTQMVWTAPEDAAMAKLQQHFYYREQLYDLLSIFPLSIHLRCRWICARNPCFDQQPWHSC